MSKTVLAARPMFHHQRETIEAHDTIVSAALAIARHPQGATGVRIRRIIQSLRPIQQIIVRAAGHEHMATDPISPTAQAILDPLTDEVQRHAPGGTSQARPLLRLRARTTGLAPLLHQTTPPSAARPSAGSATWLDITPNPAANTLVPGATAATR